jgi:hypothetical protein
MVQNKGMTQNIDLVEVCNFYLKHFFSLCCIIHEMQEKIINEYGVL